MGRGFEARRIGVVLCAALLTACASAAPTPECDPGHSNGSATIGCGQAVSAARAKLPSTHPDIARIQFLFGDFRPILPQLGWPGTRAYVVFTFADHSRQAVALSLFQGKLIALPPQPY